MGIACATAPAVTRALLRALVGVHVLFSGTASAHTMDVTTCNHENAKTVDDIGFSFCRGGTYCTPADVVSVTPDDGLGNINYTIGVVVSLGYEPTTLEISNPGIDAWCLTKLSWEGGNDLLGDSAAIWFDSQFGVDNGCTEGLISPGSSSLCQGSWRFFNLNGADGYTYDVRVKACEGTKSATVQAAFCSTAWCSTEKGELAYTTLTMDDTDGGQTTHEVELPFNPQAMKLLEVDSDWCADAMTFNGFTIFESSTSVTDFSDLDEDGTRTMTVSNLQFNGLAPTPSPTMSPTTAPTQTPASKTPLWSKIAAGVAGFVLFAVLVLTWVALKKHCRVANKSIRESLEDLLSRGSFWGAMVVLLGLFVTISVFSYDMMWGIVSICAGFVLWFLVLAWFVAFQTDTPATASLNIFCCFRGNVSIKDIPPRRHVGLS